MLKQISSTSIITCKGSVYFAVNTDELVPIRMTADWLVSIRETGFEKIMQLVGYFVATGKIDFHI